MAFKQPDPSEAGGKVPQPPSYRLYSLALAEMQIRAAGKAIFEELEKSVLPQRRKR